MSGKRKNVIIVSIISLLIFLMIYIASIDRQETVIVEEIHAVAYAIPLDKITIDGNLDDWPDDMIWYPILNHGRAYGQTDIDTVDLTASSDLTPAFTAGFNSELNLLF